MNGITRKRNERKIHSAHVCPTAAASDKCAHDACTRWIWNMFIRIVMNYLYLLIFHRHLIIWIINWISFVLLFFLVVAQSINWFIILKHNRASNAAPHYLMAFRWMVGGDDKRKNRLEISLSASIALWKMFGDGTRMQRNRDDKE